MPYIGHGLEYISDSEDSNDYADRSDLEDDSEWEDPAGAFTRDTRAPLQLPSQPAVEAVSHKVNELPQPASLPQPQPKTQRATSSTPKPAHIRLKQVAPKRSPPSAAQKATTSLYMTKHC